MMFMLLWGCSPFHVYQNNIEHRLIQHDFVHEVYIRDGYEVSYWVKKTGSKRPAVLIHGFGGSGSWTWSRILKDIADDRPVLLPDLLWFGESTSTQTPSLRTQANAMASVLDTEQWRDFDLIGTSYGGFVSLQLSLLHPDWVAQTILVDSPGPVFSIDDIAGLNQRFGMGSPADLFIPRSADGIQDLVDICHYNNPIRIPKGILKEVWENTSFSKYHAEKGLLLRDLMESQGNFTDVEWKIDHVIWGSNDEIFPLSEAEELVDLTGATLSVIPNTAHCPFVERPSDFVKIILPLLGDIQNPTVSK
jgi:pimeloyl-ACP methyl ester carboxylesterase